MSKNDYFSITNTCRLSGLPLNSSEIIASFDSLPICGLFFNSFQEAVDKRMPMTLILSEAGLIQLKETMDDNLYHYYKSGIADDSHRNWLYDISKQIELQFSPSQKILEIGGGEGMLLQYLSKKGFTKLFNVDPSHENENASYYEAIIGLFPDALDLSKYKDGFSCIIGQHFLEHVPDPLHVMQSAYQLLSTDGELWIEVPDIESSALDSYYQNSIIYPLHLTYFTKKSLAEMGKKAGLSLKSIEIIDHYGKSIWAKFTKAEINQIPTSDLEERHGIKEAIQKYFNELGAFANDIPKDIICWGAAERAHTTYSILSCFGITAKAIFDSNPEIWGMYISGIDSPIQNPESFPEAIDHLLILSQRNHISIVNGIKHKLFADTMLHIPFVGHYTFKEYERQFLQRD